MVQCVEEPKGKLVSNTTPAPGTLRDEFEKLVLADLHGPAGGPEEEVNEASMSERYLVGMLAPRRNPFGGELLEGLELSGSDSREDGKTDITAPRQKIRDIVQNRIDPLIIPRLNYFEHEGTRVLRVSVPQGDRRLIWAMASCTEELSPL